MEPNNDSLKATAAAAGLRLSDDRLEVLAASAFRVAAVLAALAAIDYGSIEPAARFQPPSATRKPS